MKRIFGLFCAVIIFLSGCINLTPTSTEQEKSDFKIAASSVVVAKLLDKLDVDIVAKPTTQSTLPERYNDIPDVGMASSPNFEQLISTGANLLIGDSFFKNSIDEKAANYNIQTAYIDTTSYEKFMNSILEIGTLLSKSDKAQAIVSELKKPIEEIKEKYKDKQGLTFAVIFGSSSSNMLATNYSYIGNLATTIGAKNITDIIAEDNTSSYIDLSLETLLVQNPDVILRFSHGDLESSKKNFDDTFNSNSVYTSLKAYKENRIYDLDPTYFNVTADFNSPTAISELGKILYE